MNAYEYGVKLALDELGITKEAQDPPTAAGMATDLLGSFGRGRGGGQRQGGGMGQGGRQPRKIPQMSGMVGRAQRGIQARQRRQRRYLNM